MNEYHNNEITKQLTQKSYRITEQLYSNFQLNFNCFSQKRVDIENEKEEILEIKYKLK